MSRTVNRSAMVLVASLLVLGAGTVAVSAQTSTSESHVTFTKDVAPILQRSCQNCHRPGQMGPMSLLTYSEVRPWARSIKLEVETREMPPWYVDRTIGVQAFTNDTSLNDREITTISHWVDAGAPRGDLADLPPPRQFDDTYKWTLPGGEPDLVVYAPEHTVKANSHEEWHDWEVEFTLPADRWVRAYELRPAKEGIPVVHHLLASFLQGDSDANPQAAGGMAGVQYAPGKPATVYPDDSGFLLKAGTSKVLFGLHYSSVDRAVTDRAHIGFSFYPQGYVPSKKAVRINWMSLSDLDLPAGERDIRSDEYMITSENYRVLTYLPHMHIRGQRQCIELIYPDGKAEMMNCFDFNFNWQLLYEYEEDAQPLVPKGTVVHVINWHDNSTTNPLNPDPKNWTGYGQRTIDDMAITMTEGILLTDEEFEKAVETRRQKNELMTRRDQD